MLKIDGVTHWSIPVNDLEESERFYRDLLGLECRGRLGNSHMTCFHVGGHDILLCERKRSSCAARSRTTACITPSPSRPRNGRRRSDSFTSGG